jgi:hypothetical protein
MRIGNLTLRARVATGDVQAYTFDFWMTFDLADDATLTVRTAFVFSDWVGDNLGEQHVVWMKAYSALLGTAELQNDLTSAVNDIDNAVAPALRAFAVFVTSPDDVPELSIGA